LLKLGEARQERGLMTPAEVIRNYQGGINAFLDPSKRIKGISTGFTKLDEMTGGLHSGELIILAARPSMGKTALALNIAWHVATRLFQPVAIFSLEMSQESLLTRMLCAAARVDSQRFRTGYLNEKERQLLRAAANQMVEAPLHIDDTAGLNLMDMHAKLRRLKQSGQKIGLVVVDYLQLMSAKGRSENRNQEVSQMSRGLKLLSKELDCPFLVLSQLSRATETRVGDHRPQLSDLRESGSIEQDADLVGFIFREEVYKRDREDLHGVAELILAKQRNGPIGTVPMVFLHAQTRFENRAEDLGDLPPE
jgi:replicative DNA helicase